MDNKNDKNKVDSPLQGFLRYFYGNFVVLLLGFVSIPLITRVMSNEQYGRTGMFTSAVTILYIFAILGMDQTYIRYYYQKGVDRRELMLRCLLPSLGIVSVICIVYALLSNYANDFLFGSRGWDLTLLVIAYTVISVFERFLFLDIRMSQNGRLYSNLNILSKVIYITLIILFARIMGDDFRVVMWAMTLSLGLITIGILIRYLAINFDGKIAKGDIERLSQKELIRYGAPFILVLLLEWLLSSCDKWSIRIWSDYGELGIYNSAMNIMSILLTFKATFVAFWSPVAMQKYENDTYENCVDFFKRAFNVTRFLCIAAGIGLILLRGVIVLVLGPDYRGAVQVIPFLTLMPVFSILFEITNQGIKFKKLNHYLNYASLFAIVVNISGNALLVPLYGGKGAAISTGITYLMYFAIGTFFSNRCYEVGYDGKKTMVMGAILLVYACVASILEPSWPDALVGLLALGLVLLTDRQTFTLCIGQLMQMLSRFKVNRS
ncbi:MAG: lipopolysaccharide biosynthesis protein [Lachnospiraceae bacterium]|nr:lipopolysaccharide biosynthesis protein [Lachnospiraceae bacterium]